MQILVHFERGQKHAGLTRVSGVPKDRRSVSQQQANI